MYTVYKTDILHGLKKKKKKENNSTYLDVVYSDKLIARQHDVEWWTICSSIQNRGGRMLDAPACTQFIALLYNAKRNHSCPFSLCYSFAPSVKNSSSCRSAQGSCSVQRGRGNATCTKRSVQFPPQNKLEGDGNVSQGASCEKKSRRVGGWAWDLSQPSVTSSMTKKKKLCRKDNVHAISSSHP